MDEPYTEEFPHPWLHVCTFTLASCRKMPWFSLTLLIGNSFCNFPNKWRARSFLNISSDSQLLIEPFHCWTHRAAGKTFSFLSFFFFFFFYFFSCTHDLWKFLGQGLNLRHSCSKAGSLSHCARLRIELRPPQRQIRSLTHFTAVGTFRKFFFVFLFFVFSGPHLWHMQVPRLGIQSEL